MSTPIVSPIVALLRSRKFIVGMIGLVLDVLVAAVPDLVVVREELITAITVIVGLIIGGIAVEDGAEKFGASRSQAQIETAQEATK